MIPWRVMGYDSASCVAVRGPPPPGRTTRRRRMWSARAANTGRSGADKVATPGGATAGRNIVTGCLARSRSGRAALADQVGPQVLQQHPEAERVLLHVVVARLRRPATHTPRSVTVTRVPAISSERTHAVTWDGMVGPATDRVTTGGVAPSPR